MSQEQTIIDHLTRYGEITTWEAITKYRITRLGAYIETLRNDKGYNITTTIEHNGRSKWARYRLTPKDMLFPIPPNHEKETQPV